MLEGYNADDAYIMVEDEFQAVAQAFTARLHQAEYKRLMRKAKEAPPKELPEPAPGMSIETKKQLERSRLLERQRSSLQDVTNGGAEEEDLDDEKVDDPWSGTHLAGLMGGSRQSKTSLVGLERMTSNTRAAQGFGRGEGDSPRKPKSIVDIFGALEGRTQVRLGRAEDYQTSPSKDRHTKMSSGLAERGNRTENGVESEVQGVQSGDRLKSMSRVQLKEPVREAAGTVAPPSGPRSTTKRRIANFDDGFDVDMLDVSEPVDYVKPKPKINTEGSTLSTQAADREKQQRKARLQEVPMFIV